MFHVSENLRKPRKLSSNTRIHLYYIFELRALCRLLRGDIRFFDCGVALDCRGEMSVATWLRRRRAMSFALALCAFFERAL